MEKDKEFDAFDTFYETGSGDAKPKWGGGNVCPKCQKTVYFAEQLKVLNLAGHLSILCLLALFVFRRCSRLGTRPASPAPSATRDWTPTPAATRRRRCLPSPESCAL